MLFSFQCPQNILKWHSSNSADKCCCQAELNQAILEVSFGASAEAGSPKIRSKLNVKAEYTTELAQDLKAVHGLDAETELANILSQEILHEINREVLY